MPETFGERLRRLRLARGMDRETVAARCKCSEVSLHYWEAGRNKPTADRLVALARALRTTTDFLLTGREAPQLAALHQAILTSLHPDPRLVAMVRGA